MIALLEANPSIRATLDAVHPAGDHRHALARIVWSVLAEPGDGVAGTLIDELGPLDALRYALDEKSSTAASVSGRAIADGRSRWRSRAEPATVADAISGARDVGARLVLPGDPAWPEGLDDLGVHAPMVLWVRGDVDLLGAGPRVAIVGARAASGYGEMIAADFAGDLAAGGAVVVSGGAYGIDGAAHRAALSVEGKTIAFLAGGIDRAYPQGHQQLFRRIVEKGAVVSEVPCGTAPTKWRFLARNRLIAAVSHATVVVEAGWRSGSLNTAGHAAALGRPLGAVPGPITSPASAGCHRLLREYDARCVTTVEEIRELWGDSGGGGGVGAEVGETQNPDQVRLLDAMSGRAALSVVELSRRSGLAPDRISAMLGLLELSGHVLRTERGWQRGAPRRRDS